MKQFLFFLVIIQVRAHSWIIPPSATRWGDASPAADLPAEGLVVSAGQSIVLTGMESGSVASDDISMGVTAPDGQSAEMNLDTLLIPINDVTIYGGWPMHPGIHIEGSNGEEVVANGTYTDIDGMAGSMMTTGLTGISEGNIETSPTASSSESMEQLAQSSWGQAASETNVAPAAGGWGSDSAPTNVTVMSAGDTIVIQNMSSSSAASDDVSISANGTDSELNFGQYIYTENNNHVQTEGISGTSGTTHVNADTTELQMQQDNTLNVTASVSGAEGINFTEKPSAFSNFSVAGMVISDWISIAITNGT